MTDDQCFYIIDVETTGLDCRRHEIIEFAGVKIISGCVEDRISIKIQPELLNLADPAALKINGYTELGWSGAITQNDAVDQISDWFADGSEYNITALIGHNVWFDYNFVSSLFRKHDVPSCMPIRRICTKDLAVAMLLQYGLDNFSLSSCCKFLGIKTQDLHQAENDVTACFEIYRRLNPKNPYLRFMIHQSLMINGGGFLPESVIHMLDNY